MARQLKPTARLKLEDFQRLGVRPHEFRSIVIREAAARKTRELAKQQLTSPSDQVGLRLARVATTTYRLLDPRLREESTHSAYVGRILPQSLSWASRTSFGREASQFGSVSRESGQSPFERSSLSDAELIEMLDLDSPPRSKQLVVNDWKESLSDADLLQPRRLKRRHLQALGWLVVTAACFAFGVGSAAIYRWLDLGRDDLGRDIAQGNAIIQSAVPSAGLADGGQSLGHSPLDPIVSMDAKRASAQLPTPVLSVPDQESRLAQERLRGNSLRGDVGRLSHNGPSIGQPSIGQTVPEAISDGTGSEGERSPRDGQVSSATFAERIVATETGPSTGDRREVPAKIASDAGWAEDRESSTTGIFDGNGDPSAVASADRVGESGSDSMGPPFPELGDFLEAVLEMESEMAAPEVLIPGLAADSGLTRPHDIPAIPSDETVGDDEAGDDEVGVGSAGEREEYAFGGELIAGEPEPSDDSLWLARLELLRRMPHLDVPFEAKNAHLRIVELELAGRRFQRSLAVDWLVQTLIAEAAWLVESVDEVEQRLGGLTGRYRVSSGKLLADTFISASLLATEPSTREHLFENGLRLCDKLLMSSEPESCKSVLEVLDSLLPSDQRESQRSTVYLKDYLSAADEMIRYVEVGDGAEVLSDPSPVKQGESLGRYDCFLRRDWETGLPWLVETANPLIAGTARDELALTESDEATKFKTVAEQWLVASSETTGRPADSMRLHAIDLLRRARERSSGPLTDTIDRQLDRLIETVPGHLLPADDWNSAWDFDPNYRFNRPEPRTAPHRSWPTL